MPKTTKTPAEQTSDLIKKIEEMKAREKTAVLQRQLLEHKLEQHQHKHGEDVELSE